jgi:hypothetical protein
MAKSETRMIQVRQAVEKQVYQCIGRRETNFAISITFGDVFQPVASMAAKSRQHP